MKKFLLLCFSICLIISSGAYAQDNQNEKKSEDDQKSVRVCIKVGGQISGVRQIHDTSKKRIPGLALGGFVQIHLKQYDGLNFYFTPELLYSQEGEKRKDRKSDQKLNFYQDYLALPLMLKGYFLNNDLMYIEFGPRLSYMINYENKSKDLDEAKEFDFALSIGGGLSLGKNNNIEIGGRLNWGLLDMYPDIPKTNYNGSATISVAYLF
ncbi:porin family protein [Massilibacteroides sp.]|uniref:porin family protein n=1 Tax=Massilibacteroides sp. TaxID=2034766 RepID=UPI002635D6FF|nr:porin family protein [Massilibacteroides sp.]MDD4516088.1 porin family protein [Massilibacteroides sp.]